MKKQCPSEELVDYIKKAKGNPKVSLPIKLQKHANECEDCLSIISHQELWDAFIDAFEHISKKNINDIREKSFSIEPGVICKLSVENSTNVSLAVITEVSKDKNCDFVRVSPIYISPFENEIDPDTDLFIPASQMPIGLPSLIEWWNDRPVMKNSISQLLGSLDKSIFSKIEKYIKEQPALRNTSKSIVIFREIEKNKGNLLSASFFEKYLTSKYDANVELEPVKKEISRNFELVSITFQQLNACNEELAMAAASNNLYEKLKEYFEKNNKIDYFVNRVEDGGRGFSIFSKDKKPFILTISMSKGKEKIFESNKKGILYLKEGLAKFEKIELKKI